MGWLGLRAKPSESVTSLTQPNVEHLQQYKTCDLASQLKLLCNLKGKKSSLPSVLQPFVLWISCQQQKPVRYLHLSLTLSCGHFCIFLSVLMSVDAAQLLTLLTYLAMVLVVCSPSTPDRKISSYHSSKLLWQQCECQYSLLLQAAPLTSEQSQLASWLTELTSSYSSSSSLFQQSINHWE